MIGNRYTFEKITPSRKDWKKIEGAYDSSCYQTREWYAYFLRIGVKPFIVSVRIDDSIIGYFFGERIWLGFPIIAAPFPGLGTYTQGLNMLQETSEDERLNIYKALSQWIFDNHYALTMQVDDWQLRRDSSKWIPAEEFHLDTIEKHGVAYTYRPTLHVALKKDEESLWNATSYTACKYRVHKAQKLGLYVREINSFDEISNFCKVHYDQLKEVCARKGTRPKLAQKEFRMKALCEALFPNRVMMVECVGKDENGVEQIMSTGIFCIDKGQCSYWTGASYRRYQKYSPNELMVWEAMRRLNERGAGDLNFCGCADYKLKFGTIYAYVPRIMFAKYSFLLNYTTKLKELWRRTRAKTIDVITQMIPS